MRIKEINISGYRSLRNFTIHPGPITVCVGPNGSGKSNIYNALRLLKAAAAGEFARSIVAEGGMDSIFWAGERTEDETGKIKIGLRAGAMSYSMRFGIMPVSERSSDGEGIKDRGLDYFRQDPDIKFEQLEFIDRGKSIPLLKRKRAAVIARNMEGRSIPYALPLESGESVLSALREPQKFPELFKLRQDFMSWRFYHDFRTDLDSPIRKPHKATMTTVLSDNGHDLTSAIATIWAVGDRERFDSLIDLAFPGAEIDLDEEDGVLDIAMVSPGLYRKLSARELSDGTLQYLLLVTALLSPRPAPFMVLNEPETSIHQDLIPSLAELIKEASKKSQVFLTTHSQELASVLKKESNCRLFELAKEDGATIVPGLRLEDQKDYEGDENESEEGDLMEDFAHDDDDDD